ncbi:MAG: Ser/Thr protein kinase RdoA (MazF antagonist) [Halieaceae bacterium]|jgi:Ser/Thr protein kinase RdoA (MazF antagonist)
MPRGFSRPSTAVWAASVSDAAFLADYLPAAREALAYFPVQAQAIDLVSLSENVTFRVTAAPDETQYVLRLHRPGYNTLQELESERIWGNALGDAGIPVQVPLRNSAGQHFVRVAIPARAEHRYVGITSWFPGVPIGRLLEPEKKAGLRQQSFRKIGKLAARIHTQSESWRPPANFARRRLDEDGLLGDAPRWGRFWEHADLTEEERRLLLHARQHCLEALHKLGRRSDNFSLIHADLHPGNIVVDGECMGLIDFDDTAYGWHAYELACALIEYSDDEDFPALRAALLEGYRGTRALSKNDEDMLPIFILIRGMSIIGWLHQRPEHADSGYFQETKCRVLAQYQELNGDEVHTTA